MAVNNVICTQCGKAFHMKPFQLNRFKRTFGVFCSRKCFAEYRKTAMKGAGNHQYGLKGPLNSSFKGVLLKDQNHNMVDLRIYAPTHPFCNSEGRVLYHRYIVEQNYSKFNPEFFMVIDGKYYLRRDLEVHHKDGNHANNDLDNLQIVTKSEHRHIHQLNSAPRPRDPKTGRFLPNEKN